MRYIQVINKSKLHGALTSKPFSFSFRSWELEYVPFFDFLDGSCRSIYLGLRGTKVMRILPRLGFVDSGLDEWITDRIRFSFDGFSNQRLFQPMGRESKKNKFKEISWVDSFFRFFFIAELSRFDFTKELNTFSFFGRSSDLITMKGLLFLTRRLGWNNFFFPGYGVSNSLLPGSVLQDAGTFLAPESVKKGRYVIVGVNLRLESPYTYLKVLNGVREGGKAIVFGSGSNFLPSTVLGGNFKDFLNFFKGKHGLSSAFLFSPDGKSSFTSFFLGANFFYYHFESLSFSSFYKKFCTSFFFCGFSPSFFASQELGLSRFLDTGVSDKESISLFMDTTPSRIRKSFSIFLGSHGEETLLDEVDLVLPSTFILEKKTLLVSELGDVIRRGAVLLPPGGARADWRIFSAFQQYVTNVEFLKNFTFINFFFSNLNYEYNFLVVNKISEKVSLFRKNLLCFVSLKGLLEVSLNFQGMMFTPFFLTAELRASSAMALGVYRFRSKNSFFI